VQKEKKSFRGLNRTSLPPLQALFDSLGHKNVLVNGRLEQGPVQLKDGDLIEVCCSSLSLPLLLILQKLLADMLLSTQL